VCCWPAGVPLTIPDYCDYTYKNMTEWGRKMFVTPGIVVDGKLVTTDLVDINLNIRILLGSSYYDEWKKSADFREDRSAGKPGG
jgi:hydrogenase large subunit